MNWVFYTMTTPVVLLTMCIIFRRPNKGRPTIEVLHDQSSARYVKAPMSSQVDPIAGISNDLYGRLDAVVENANAPDEDEYARLDAAPIEAPVRDSNEEGTIRYASLLWDTKPDPPKKEIRIQPPPSLPPRLRRDHDQF